MKSTQGVGSLLGTQLVVVSVIFYALAFIAVTLRVVAKVIHKRKFASHDYLIFGALIACTGSAISDILGVELGGVGRHVTQVSEEQVVITLKLLFTGSWTWITATVLIKLSILRLYLSLFAPNRFFRLACHLLELLSILFVTGIALTVVLICHPFKKNWYTLVPGHCGNRVAEEVAAATGVFVLDLSLVLLPMPILWNLNMPLRKKIVLSVMFSMGIIVMGINIARIVVTVRLNQSDFTYLNAYASLFASLELFLGVVVACLPTLAPLLTAALHRRNTTYYRTSRPLVVSNPPRMIASTLASDTSDGKFQLLTNLEQLDSQTGSGGFLEMDGGDGTTETNKRTSGDGTGNNSTVDCGS